MGIFFVGDVKVTEDEATLRWSCSIAAIDADGSPNAYRIDDRGLDWLANAYRVASRRDPRYRRWDQAGFRGWSGAVVLDSVGHPLMQADGVSLISPTSLGDHNYPSRDQRRYVNSETIRYVALPPEMIAAEAALGDVGVAERLDVTATFIFGDVAPRGHLSGEVSIALARALGVKNSSPKNGGDRSSIVTSFILYKKSAASPPWPRADFGTGK